ncbi:MAG: transglycosylase domain-containing protein [Patescibacteria group bacterium]
MKFLWSKSRELLDLAPKSFKKDYWIFIVKRRPWLKWTFLILFLFLLFSFGSGYWYMYNYDGCFFNVGCLTDDKGQPLDIEKLARSDFKKASYVYADNGEEIGKYFDEIRDPILFDKIPKLIQDAFVAAEDKRFYQHHGIDIKAIASAAMGNALRSQGIKIWKRSGGASTITQQLSRTIFADKVIDFKTRARTYNRKLKEARLAIRLEKRYSKKEILGTFLNFIWLGHGANGVVAGSMRYWGKDIRKESLTIREAAILASMNKNSVLYDPIFCKPSEPNYGEKLTKEVIRLATAKDRYNFVLEQMRDNGFISQKEYEKNLFQKDKNPDTEELAQLRSWKNSAYDYGNRLVKEMLLTSGHNEDEISQIGGLRIYTTINPSIQKIASEEFNAHLALINQEKGPDDKLNGAFIIIDVKTGEIKALSGGNNFEKSQYNRVLAYRSPGSGVKPFVYATAMEKFGYDFFTKACNTPFRMKGANGKAWAPQNFKEKNPRPADCNRDTAEGVIYSLNLETLNIARKISMPPIVALMNSFGIWGNPGIVRDSNGNIWFRRPGYEITGGLVPLLPTAIGASDVSLLELANAYTVFYRSGTYITPRLIKEIKSTYGEEILFKPKSVPEKRVLSQKTSDKILALMRAVTKIGTAKISMRDIKQQVACKTGTSDGPRDVSMWCGTPELFVAVRFGLDNYGVIELPEYMRKKSGVADMQVSGGWVVGPLVRKIIDRIYAQRQKVEFSPEVEAELQRLLANPQ